MQILVTGANGFVGRSLIPLLCKNGYLVRLGMRDINKNIFENEAELDGKVSFDLSSDFNEYDELLNDIDVVIHLAARVHIMNESGNEEEYEKINTIGVERLAKEAAKRDIKRFIFLSSIKVNGEKNLIDDCGIPIPFKEDDIVSPEGAYASSKMGAETVIRNVCNSSNMNFVILRPVLIYGPSVKANFLSLLKIVNKSYPLPLASIKNRRSLIYVKNLADILMKSIDVVKASNKIYLVSDVDISVPDLLRVVSKYLNKRLFLFPFPIGILKLIGFLTGKKKVIDRLTESMLVDNSRFTEELQWKPPYSLEQGIQSTVEWYKKA